MLEVSINMDCRKSLKTGYTRERELRRNFADPSSILGVSRDER